MGNSCNCNCNCGDFEPVFNDEVINYNPIFGPCGNTTPTDPAVIIYDGGGVDGYDD